MGWAGHYDADGALVSFGMEPGVGRTMRHMPPKAGLGSNEPLGSKRDCLTHKNRYRLLCQGHVIANRYGVLSTYAGMRSK